MMKTNKMLAAFVAGTHFFLVREMVSARDSQSATRRYIRKLQAGRVVGRDSRITVYYIWEDYIN